MAINIQTVGTGRTHATLSAFATWLQSRDLVANNEIVEAHVYNSATITGNCVLYPGNWNATCYCIIRPAPGLGVNDLDPNGDEGYGTTGIELTRLMQSNNFAVSHGVSMRGFRLSFTAGGAVPGLSVARVNTSPVNDIFNAELKNCRIKVAANQAGGYGIHASTSNSNSRITDNVFFFTGTAGSALVAGGASDVSRNTFITSAGATPTVMAMNTLTTVKWRDNVFVNSGVRPINRDVNPAICTNNFADTNITVGPTTGFTITTLMLESELDLRPVADSPIINGASTFAQSTNDLIGGFRGTVPDAGAVMRVAQIAPVAPTVTITGIVLRGQRATVTGNYTSNVETSTATVAAAATPNGAIGASTGVSASGGVFTAVFNNLTPGNYAIPSIELTNQGGTGISTGGNVFTIDVPALPVVNILSQIKNGTTLTVSGQFTGGIPITASVTLPAAPTPNGAITKGPQAVTVNDNGLFSVLLSSIAAGNYAPPIVSATNFSGTSSDTGEPLPRFYANGTQPIGGEAAAVVNPFVPTLFDSPTKNIGSTITEFTLENYGVSTSTNAPFTFGQPFVQGQLKPGDFLVGKTLGLDDISLQVNVKSTHPDGSIRHAVISGVVTTLAAGVKRIVSIVKTRLSPVTYVPIPSALIMDVGVGFSTHAVIVLSGVTYIARPDDVLNAGVLNKDIWLAGSIVTEYIVNVPFLNPSDVPHATLTAQFSIRYYKDVGKVKVDIAVEDTNAFLSTTEKTYDAELFVNGVSIYSRAEIVHRPHSRWKMTGWLGNPQVRVTHNVPYLLDTKMIFNYDRDLVISETLLQYYTDSMSLMFPMSSGLLVPDMSGTGGRPDIGPLPQFGAAALISQDKRALDIMYAHADFAAGSWTTHRRDKSSGPGAERPLSIMYYPNATIYAGPGDANNISTGGNEWFGNVSRYGAETAHQPSLAYLPYLLSGDFYYLEELHFWTNWNHYQSNPEYRNYGLGLFKAEQTRAQGWCMRTLSQAAGITPDAHPDKAHFIYWLENNLAYYNSTYSDNPTANTLGLMDNTAVLYPTSGANPGIGAAPWQDDYFTIGAATAMEFGFSNANRLIEWKAKFTVGRMLEPGCCYIDSCVYYLNVRATNVSPLYTTLAECYAATFDSTHLSFPCNSQARLDYMNDNRALPSNAFVLNEITGNAQTTVGYPSILQAAMSMLANIDYSDADLAWDLVNNRAVKPDYANSPQFAMMARPLTVASFPDTWTVTASGLINLPVA